MAIMIDKLGNSVDVPEADLQTATAQGFTTAPTGVTAGMNKSQIAGMGQTPINAGLDPMNTGKVYNPNADPTKGFYAYNTEGGVSWNEPKTSQSPEDLKKETNLTLPTTEMPNASEPNALVAGANANVNEIIKAYTPDKTPEQKSQQTLLDQMATLTGEFGNKAADQLTAEQANKVPELRQQFSEINSKILTRMAEYDALSTAQEGKPITMSSIIGAQAQIQRMKASEIGLLQAQAQGLQGQLTTAQETANRAVDLKYSTKEAQLNTLQAQMNALEPTLSRQDKITLQAQQILLDNQRQAIADKKEEEKNIQGVMLEAMKNGITDTETLNKISSAKSYNEALKTLGENMPIATDSNVQNLMDKYPDAGIMPTDDFVTAQSKLRNSRIYQQATRLSGIGGGTGTGGGGVGVGAVNEQLYTGLSSATATAVRSKVSKFSTEPLVQNFATIQDGYNFASAIPDKTKNPADDQALIYSLAKALDPGSVVREGEYATAQKYAQSWIKAYGKGVSQALLGTGFLSEEARKNIKATIKQKYEASKKSYDNLSNQYESGINSLTGRKDGNQFLVEYSIPATQEVVNTANITPQTEITKEEPVGFFAKVGNWLWGD